MRHRFFFVQFLMILCQ